MRSRMAQCLLLALCLMAGGCQGNANEEKRSESPVAGAAGTPLLISRQQGKPVEFRVVLAIDEASQQKGLMGRTSLPADEGMLFPFAYPETASFWMKDTRLPLDLIFIRPDGIIAAILPGKPMDLHPLSAQEPVSAVLEINQGRAAALGIEPGNRVSWGDCSSPPPPQGVWRADRFCPDQVK